jgi:biotin carboxylase
MSACHLRTCKTVHVLGAGLWQVPTIRLAKELGFRVLVTDMYADRPGYEFADVHEVIDIRNVAATLNAAQRHNIDGIVCDTTDAGVPTAAYVAEKLGLPGISYDTALRFTNKFLMREATAKAGVGNPAYVLVTSLAGLDAADAVGFPAVVKPVDSQSSRGVRIVENRAALPSAFQHALDHSMVKQVLVESWIAGTEYTVESMCCDGQVLALAFSDKERYPEIPQVASRLTYPPAAGDDVIDRIRDANRRVIAALGLRTGVTHAEFIVTPEGRVVLVEIAARGGGNRILSHIVPYLSGVPLMRCYLEYCVGGGSRWPAPDAGLRAASLQFLTFPKGTVRSIAGVDRGTRFAGVAELVIELEVGERFAGIDDDRSRPGYVLVLGDTREEVLATSASVQRVVRGELD